MSRKIWRKLSLVAMSSGVAFGGIGCIGFDGILDLQRLGAFIIDNTIVTATGIPAILAGFLGGGA